MPSMTGPADLVGVRPSGGLPSRNQPSHVFKYIQGGGETYNDGQYTTETKCMMIA